MQRLTLEDVFALSDIAESTRYFPELTEIRLVQRSNNNIFKDAHLAAVFRKCTQLGTCAEPASAFELSNRHRCCPGRDRRH